MIQKVIIEELKSINQLLKVCLHQMDDILSSKTRNVMWRMFFPAGQFMQQKSMARKTSLDLLKVDTRLKEMEQVLEERNHPVKPQITRILTTDLITMSEKLVDLPERAQYLILQVESIQNSIENLIHEFTIN